MAQGGAAPKFNNRAMMCVIDFEAGWKSHFHLARSPAGMRWQSRACLPRAGLEPAAADARGSGFRLASVWLGPARMMALYLTIEEHFKIKSGCFAAHGRGAGDLDNIVTGRCFSGLIAADYAA